MRLFKFVVASLVLFACGSANATDVTWFEPKNASNSAASWPSGGTYQDNFGVAFLSGVSDNIDWITLGLSTSAQTAGSFSLTVALRDSTSTTPYVGVAGTTEYAADTVTFTAPTTAQTYFTVNLRAADIPNISNYVMTSGSAYTLILYAPNLNIALQRTTNFSNGTTNNEYTVSNGFTALDTFRDNTANWTNISNSYPTLAISFGSTTAVPEPSTYALGAIATGVLGFMARRRKAKQA